MIRAVRRSAVAGLGQAARGGGRRGLAVGAIDETSQVRQGERTAGVKRHYLGCAGKVANGITTVHLAYAREGIGHALIAARQWIPRGQLEDLARRRVMRLPPDLAFRARGQLAIDLIGEVLADGIGLDFACGDEVYGRCTQLREYLEARGLAYVLRVPAGLLPHRGPRGAADLQAGRRHAAGRPGHLRRHRRPAPPPHRHPGTRPGPAGPAPARRPGADPAHRPRDRRAARPSAPARRQPALAGPAPRHQALPAWYHQRTRLARDEHVLLVSQRPASTAAAISP